MKLKEEIKKLAKPIAENLNADILFYNGAIRRPEDRKFIEICRKKRKRGKNILLILVTNGGDADAAYRMARCLQQKYSRFTIYISGCCKSAGTLIATGAHEIIMSDHGELGPLDVQLEKSDELWEMSSGLTTMNAVVTLQQKSFEMFEDCFLALKHKSRGQITLKTATDLASALTIGLFGKMYQQIDPIHLGEVGLAMNIAKEYGSRLNIKSKNLKSDEALMKLIAAYPSHSFAIDREEAQELFNNVRIPTESENSLAECLSDLALDEQSTISEPFYFYISDILYEESQETKKQEKVQEGENNASQKIARKNKQTEKSGVGATPGNPSGTNADGHKKRL